MLEHFGSQKLFYFVESDDGGLNTRTVTLELMSATVMELGDALEGLEFVERDDGAKRYPIFRRK